jgi:hypothetical protein
MTHDVRPLTPPLQPHARGPPRAALRPKRPYSSPQCEGATRHGDHSRRMRRGQRRRSAAWRTLAALHRRQRSAAGRDTSHMQMCPKVSQPSGRAICVRADTRHACRQVQAGGLRRHRERSFVAKTAAGARKPRRIHPNCAHVDHAPAHLPPSRRCTRRRTSSSWRRRACRCAIRPTAPSPSSKTTPSSPPPPSPLRSVPCSLAATPSTLAACLRARARGRG